MEVYVTYMAAWIPSSIDFASLGAYKYLFFGKLDELEDARVR